MQNQKRIANKCGKYANIFGAIFSSFFFSIDLQANWQFNLGDTALSVVSIETTPVQPTIIVLCRRTLFAFTHGGVPRFQIRLQAIATSLLVYKTRKFFLLVRIFAANSKCSFSVNDATVQMCVGTATRTLLLYRDATLVWSAQLPFVPVDVLLASFKYVNVLKCIKMVAYNVSLAYFLGF